MKRYFYSNGVQKEGPLTLEELKNSEIESNTLIWHEGLDGWTEAATLDELRGIFELRPPPIETVSETTAITDSQEFKALNQELTTKSFSVKKQRLFSDPFSFYGRIRRIEYAITFLIVIVANAFIDSIVSQEQFSLTNFAYIPIIWLFLAQGARRSHDTGLSGWWQLVPLYVLWLLFAPGKKLPNKYGRNPR